MTKDLDRLMQNAASFCVKLFAKTGEVRPLWDLVGEDGSHHISPTPWRDNQEKAAYVGVLRELVRKHGIVRYVLMVEAWTVCSPSEERLASVLKYGASVSTHPDRREVVVLVGADRADRILHCGTMAILRPEHGRPVIAPLKMPADPMLASRFDLFVERVP